MNSDNFLSLIIVLVVIVLIASLIGFQYKKGQERHAIWVEFARSVNAQHEPYFWFGSAEKITCPTPLGTIILRARSEYKKHGQQHFTEASAQHNGTLDFTVRHINAIRQVGTALGLLQPIQTGVTDLDRQFIITSNNETAVRQYLQNTAVADAICRSVTDKLVVSAHQHTFKYSEDNFVEDPARLRELYDLMYTLMHSNSQSGDFRHKNG